MASHPATPPQRDIWPNRRNFEDATDRRFQLGSPDTPQSISANSTPVRLTRNRLYRIPGGTPARPHRPLPVLQVPQVGTSEPNTRQLLLNPFQWIAWTLLVVLRLTGLISHTGTVDTTSGPAALAIHAAVELDDEDRDLDDFYDTSWTGTSPDTSFSDVEEFPSPTPSRLRETAAEPSSALGVDLQPITPQWPNSLTLNPAPLPDDDPPPDYASRTEGDEVDEEAVDKIVAIPRPVRDLRSIAELTDLEDQLAGDQRQAEEDRAGDAYLSAEQKKAARWMRARGLGDERGGILQFNTTPNAVLIAVRILEAKSQSTDGVTLIVCSKDRRTEWEANLEEVAPDLNVQVHHGHRRPINGKGLSKCDVVITTYGVLRQEHSNISEQKFHTFTALWEVSYDRVIFDECQEIPKPSTKTFEACRAFVKLCSCSWLLARRNFEIPRHNVFLALLPVIPRGREVYQAIRLCPTSDGPDLQRSVQAHPPTPDVKIHLLQLGDAEYVFYLWIRNAISSQIQALLNGELDCDEVQSAYILLCRMVQVCCQSNLWFKERHLIDFGKAACLVCLSTEARKTFKSGVCITCMNMLDDIPSKELTNPLFDTQAPTPTSTKLGGLVELLFEIFETSQNSAGGGKVVICSQWSDYLTVVSNLLVQVGIAAVNLDNVEPGSPTRAASLRRFHQDNHVAVALLHTDVASKTDIDLSVANHMVLLNVLPDPDVEDRCVDVIRRAGKTTQVTVWKLLMADTIEVELQKLQSRKRSADEPDHRLDDPSYGGLTLQDIGEVVGLTLS